jgi:von Hippel-Lindau disease tumor supressor
MFSRFSLAAILSFLANCAYAAGETCPGEGGLRSKRGDRPAEMEFINRTDHSIRIYWINYDGGRKFYAAVRPGGSHLQQTYRTHPWVVTDGRENCIGIYFPYRHGRSVVIRD